MQPTAKNASAEVQRYDYFEGRFWAQVTGTVNIANEPEL